MKSGRSLEQEENGSYVFIEDVRREDVVVGDGEQESLDTEVVVKEDKDLY